MVLTHGGIADSRAGMADGAGLLRGDPSCPLPTI